jgi:hypothetical protein
LRSLDHLICFDFLCFDVSLIASAVADIYPPTVSLHNTHTDGLTLFCVFVLLSTHLHIVLLLSRSVYICSILSLTGTASVCAAHFSCQKNTVVCFLEWGVGGWMSKVLVCGCLPT